MQSFMTVDYQQKPQKKGKNSSTGKVKFKNSDLSKESIDNFIMLLEKNKESIISTHSHDTFVSKYINILQLQRGIATLKQYRNHLFDYQHIKTKGGIAILASYSDPSFALLGLSLGAALALNNNQQPILIKLHKMLQTYTPNLEKIIKKSGLFPNIQFYHGNSNEFIKHCMDSVDYKTVHVYGEPWLKKYIPLAKQTKTALLFYGPGNNPAIVHQSANLELSADRILRAAYVLSGQAAVCIDRLIIDDRIDKQKFNSILKHKCKQIPVSENIDSNALVTPVKVAPMVQRLQQMTDQAIAIGAKPYNFNIKKANGGIMVTPSLFFDTNHTMQLMSDFTFMPVLPVQYVRQDEIVKLANSTDYGLTASLFGTQEVLYPLKRELWSTHGMLFENQTINEVVKPESGYYGPWGGFGLSGFYVGEENNWNEIQGANYLIYNYGQKLL